MKKITMLLSVLVCSLLLVGLSSTVSAKGTPHDPQGDGTGHYDHVGEGEEPPPPDPGPGI